MVGNEVIPESFFLIGCYDLNILLRSSESRGCILKVSLRGVVENIF